MCSSCLCHGCDAYGTFLVGERITRRLPVELQPDYVSASLRPSCYLLRCEVEDASRRPSFE